jgi:hypothetical protein
MVLRGWLVELCLADALVRRTKSKSGISLLTLACQILSIRQTPPAQGSVAATGKNVAAVLARQGIHWHWASGAVVRSEKREVAVLAGTQRAPGM